MEGMERIWYYDDVRRQKHPEVKDEWVERVLANPYHIEDQEGGRKRYYGYIEEAGHWLRVILEEGKLLNAFLDHHGLKRWGQP